MRLEEALRHFPQEAAMLDQATFEGQREAGQVCADAVRKIAREQMALLRAIMVLRAHTVEGSSSGYSMIRNGDLNEIVRLAGSLLLQPPERRIRPLPQAQPLEERAEAGAISPAKP
jgi:hypothetical protein